MTDRSTLGVDAAVAQGWLDRLIRDVPDFPEPGVVFKDITPLLAHHQAFTDIVAALSDAARSVADGRIDVVAGIEARGFILAAPVSLTLGAGFVPVRKQGKLPGDTHAVSYSLEYGDATLEVKADAFGPGSRVLLLDDVLATGGTVAATADLVRETGADVVGVVVLLELGFLNGRARLGDLPVTALRTV